MNDDILPDWAVSSIRKAALRSCMGWSLPMGAAVLLLTGIGALIYLGEAEKPWIPFFWLAVFGGALAIFCWEFFRSLKVLLIPRTSPELSYLRRFGSLPQVLSEVAGELASPSNSRFGPEVTVTSRWLVVSGGESFAVRRLDDLVWAFPKEDVFKILHTIPVRRFPYAEFRSAAGEDCRAQATAEEAAALFRHLAERCPGIMLGWSDELQKAWDDDREAFVTDVLAERKGS
ncbi:MAG: hypothetical protein HY924_03745 [Elusimicrobia bacterium]|nr:hypothetical protein [Elusimicrobiota bacterium]